MTASVDEADQGTTAKLMADYSYLKSFQFPDYGPGNLGPVRPPHQVCITVGKFFRYKGVIEAPSFTFLPPYDEQGYPNIIEAHFTFRVVNDSPLSFDQVRRGYSYVPRVFFK